MRRAEAGLPRPAGLPDSQRDADLPLGMRMVVRAGTICVAAAKSKKPTTEMAVTASPSCAQNSAVGAVPQPAQKSVGEIAARCGARADDRCAGREARRRGHLRRHRDGECRVVGPGRGDPCAHRWLGRRCGVRHPSGDPRARCAAALPAAALAGGRAGARPGRAQLHQHPANSPISARPDWRPSAGKAAGGWMRRRTRMASAACSTSCNPTSCCCSRPIIRTGCSTAPRRARRICRPISSAS